MPFLVFEPDALVRNDICETLAAEFQGDLIAIADTLDAIRDLAGTVTSPLVAVLSLPGDATQKFLEQFDNLAASNLFIVIGDDASELGQLRDRIVFLQRPFSSTTLVGSIRAALDNLSS